MAPQSLQQVAERIGELVGASAVTALHTSRHLRTATDALGQRLDLWPQPGSGNRSNAFTPAQGVNLLLALSANNPIRSAEIVAAFRGLSNPGSATWVFPPTTEGDLTTTQEFAKKGALLRGPTLGDDLNFAVEWLCGLHPFTQPATTSALDSSFGEAEFRETLCQSEVRLILAPRYAASFVLSLGDGAHIRTDYGEQPAAPSVLYRLLAASSGETVGALEALARIWLESQEALRPPTNETAALYPWQGTNAAAPSQPSTPERKRGRHTSQKLSVRESALNGFAAGPPVHRGEAQCPIPTAFR